jgi:hypothetical protein
VKRVHRPCSECPWRTDATPGRFTRERWTALSRTCADIRTQASPEFGDPLFACHKTPEEGERACAGWLATEGNAHPTVRLAVALGDVPIEALEPGEDWPDLHPDFAATAGHDLGVR